MQAKELFLSRQTEKSQYVVYAQLFQAGHSSSVIRIFGILTARSKWTVGIVRSIWAIPSQFRYWEFDLVDFEMLKFDAC